MTSILTNNSAMGALHTLRSIGSKMTETQAQVSTGLSVREAADNAAYWSIATTMRSDNTAISAVADALGLGAAKLDVAYSGTEAIVDLLSEFKARLVAAKEPGVDRAKIQKELSQLQQQAESVVNSASFNSVNWLKTESPTHIQDISDLSQEIVSAFVRDAGNGVSVKTASIDLRNTSMLNLGGGGILQKDILDYYMPLGGMSSYSTYHEGHEDHAFSGPVTIGVAETIAFDLVVDRSGLSAGDTFNIAVDKAIVDAALGTTDGVIANVTQMTLVLQRAFDSAGASPYATPYGTWSTPAGSYSIQSRETTAHVGSSIFIENLTGPFAKLGLATTPAVDHDNMNTSAVMNFIAPFKMLLNASIKFDVSIDGNPSATYTIDRAAVDAALGTTDGIITNANELKVVINYLTAGIGMDVAVTGNQMVFAPDQTTYPGYGSKAAAFAISSFRPDPPFTLRFDLAEIDVTSGLFTIDEYIEGVDSMLAAAIDSASGLGAISARITMQVNFTERLMDTIDKGLGRLVDADMNEASTRLKAIQTQQQLAIQSLQIANSNAGNIMQLFN
jgi:flagellin